MAGAGLGAKFLCAFGLLEQMVAAPAHSPAAVAFCEAPRSKRERLPRAWERLSIGNTYLPTRTCVTEEELGVEEINLLLLFLRI